MVKVENLSASEVVLKFCNLQTGSKYIKRLHSGAVLKLSEEEYHFMESPNANFARALKISRYNIFNESNFVEIHNPTLQRISVNFFRSESDQYQKQLSPKATLRVTQEEYAFIKDVDRRLQIVQPTNEASKVYFMPRVAQIKEQPLPTEAECIPSAEESAQEIPQPEDKLLDFEPMKDRVVSEVKKYKKEKWK